MGRNEKQVQKWAFKTWWHDREIDGHDPLEILDPHFAWLENLLVVRETERALLCRQIMKSDADGVFDGGLRWFPKSAFEVIEY